MVVQVKKHTLMAYFWMKASQNQILMISLMSFRQHLQQPCLSYNNLSCIILVYSAYMITLFLITNLPAHLKVSLVSWLHCFLKHNLISYGFVVVKSLWAFKREKQYNFVIFFHRVYWQYHLIYLVIELVDLSHAPHIWQQMINVRLGWLWGLCIVHAWGIASYDLQPPGANCQSVCFLKKRCCSIC